MGGGRRPPSPAGAAHARPHAAEITDRDTGRSRGFAFVEMSNDEEAERAINALNGIDFGGRKVNVNEARPREERPFGGGGRGDSGGYGGGGRRREPRW